MEKRKVYRQAGIGGFRRFLAAAAVLALMAASFTVGALAFSREVPVEQETILVQGLRQVRPGKKPGMGRGAVLCGQVL